MTSKQYYKQTSDMAYPLKEIMKDNNNPNKVIANIAITDGGREDALKILDENDFFSLPENYTLKNVDTDSIELEIRFHYGLDNFDCFEVDVCGIIDCSGVDGGKIVLSCEGYKLTNYFRPSQKDNQKISNSVQKGESIFDLFDDLVGCSSRFDDFFNFPAFPKFHDISKMIEETRKNIENGIDKSKSDGNSKFYTFTCKVDPDGKVHIKRSSNDGTVEKEFMLGDKNSPSNSKKIDIKDEKSDNKTELKNLVLN